MNKNYWVITTLFLIGAIMIIGAFILYPVKNNDNYFIDGQSYNKDLIKDITTDVSPSFVICNLNDYNCNMFASVPDGLAVSKPLNQSQIKNTIFGGEQ